MADDFELVDEVYEDTSSKRGLGAIEDELAKEKYQDLTRKIKELEKVRSEYEELKAYEPFKKWLEQERKRIAGQAYEDEEEISPLEQRLTVLEEEVRTAKLLREEENIAGEIESLNNELARVGLPPVEKYQDEILRIAVQKAKEAPDRRCGMTVRELYFAALSKDLPEILKRAGPSLPHFESSAGRGSSSIENKIWREVVEAGSTRW